jgi:hypothetical protein
MRYTNILIGTTAQSSNTQYSFILALSHIPPLNLMLRHQPLKMKGDASDKMVGLQLLCDFSGHETGIDVVRGFEVGEPVFTEEADVFGEKKFQTSP